jgi:multicomponent Na+:H+ antiporter subunit C
MELVLALVVGVLYGAGFYLILRRSLFKIILGLSLLSNAANLLIFASAGLTRAAAPLIGSDEKTLNAPYADPLPQALILTAIVITFGVTAFALLLVFRTYHATGTDDPDALQTTDKLDAPKEAKT